MGATCDQTSLVQYQNSIHETDTAETVGDHDPRYVLEQATQSELNLLLALTVKRRSRLIHDQDRRLLQKSPCQCDPLALPTAQLSATFTGLGLISHWERHDEIVNVGLAGSLLVGCVEYGRFRRNPAIKPNQRFWQVSAGSEALVGFFQEMAQPADSHTLLPVHGLNPHKRYRLVTKPQRQFIKRFGSLVKHILPVTLHPEGALLRWANALFSLQDCVEGYEGDGALLGSGVLLSNQFMGTYYNPQTELLGDFGSYLFVCEEKEAS